MSAPLNISASFSTLSSSVYSPITPPPPAQPHHISNLTRKRFVLYPPAFGTIKVRRACKQDVNTSSTNTQTMIPVALQQAILACRAPSIPVQPKKMAKTTLSHITGRTFHLYTTVIGTIKLRRKCTTSAGYSAAVAATAQNLTMIPTETISLIELFRSPFLPLRSTTRPRPISNLTLQSFNLRPCPTKATILLRRASFPQDPSAGSEQHATMIHHALIHVVQRASKISRSTTRTQDRIEQGKAAEKQHPQRFVQQEDQFDDLTEWLQELASRSPSPKVVGKGKDGLVKVGCKQDEEFEEFVEWLDAAQQRVEERSVLDSSPVGSGGDELV